MTAVLQGGEWSAARPGRTLLPGKTRYPFYRVQCGPQGRSGWAENLVPTGIRSRTVQPVVSHYTNWATRSASYPIYILFRFYILGSNILYYIIYYIILYHILYYIISYIILYHIYYIISYILSYRILYHVYYIILIKKCKIYLVFCVASCILKLFFPVTAWRLPMRVETCSRFVILIIFYIVNLVRLKLYILLCTQRPLVCNKRWRRCQNMLFRTTQFARQN